MKELASVDRILSNFWNLLSEKSHGVDVQGPCGPFLLITSTGDGIGYSRALGFGGMRYNGCRTTVMIARRSAGYLW